MRPKTIGSVGAHSNPKSTDYDESAFSYVLSSSFLTANPSFSVT